MTRQEIQDKAIQLISKHKHVALQWCTGLGKTKASIDMINYLADLDFRLEEKPLNVLLIVAEVAHKDNWKAEFDKWGVKTDNITIECYASMKKYKDTTWDVIIFDEAHHLGSEIRIDVLDKINTDYVILLSATLPDTTMQAISSVFGKFATSKISLKEAISWGVLPVPKVILIPLTLDNKKETEMVIEEWGKSDLRITYTCKLEDRWNYLKNKTKYPNVTLKMPCTPKQKYNYLTDQFDYWKSTFFKTRQERVKNKWLQSGSKRKRFLGEHKTDKVQLLLNKIHDKRFICFCTSIEQCEILGGKNAIHSKKDSLTIINSFNNKMISNIFAVGMLQEGQNLTDIEAGVIVQLDGQERSFIQKFGRSLRAEDPIQFIFYYKDTRDEDYLQHVLEGVDSEYIMSTNINDLEL